MAPKNFLLQLLLVHLVGLYGLQVYAETVNITLSTGNAESLCFPRSSIDRTWNVTGPRGSQVDLNCAQVTLLESDGCAEGFLSILDTAGEVKICNRSRHFTQVSSENWMTIHFKRGPCSRGRLNCFVRLKETEEDGKEGAPSPSTVSGAMDTGDHADLIAQDNKKSNRCQRRNKKRIVGGAPTMAHEYPFMAYIEDTELFHVDGGGTIITKRHVLTAAHCVKNVELSDLHVVVGGHDTETDCDNNNVQTLYIDEMYLHNYSTDTKTNDIAILLLSEDIVFTDFVQPIHLPAVRYPLINQHVTAIGWGDLNCNGMAAETLHHVSLKVVELERCRRAYESLGVSFQDPTTKICTWEPGKDTCSGDSGGPLVYVPPGSDAYVQVAVVACGICGLQEPAISTDVFAYIDWIQAKIDQYTAEPLTFQRL